MFIKQPILPSRKSPHCLSVSGHNCNCRNHCNPCNCSNRCNYLSQCVAAEASRGGYQAQLISKSEESHIHNGETVIFNSILNNSNKNIVYDTKTGEFVINKASNYFINWSVTFDGTDVNSYVIFALELNGKNYEVSAIPLVIGSVIGSSLITVTEIPARLSLKNVSGDIISFSSINPVANIVIAELN